ncbi:Serine/threonine-protein phosphatase 1 [Rubripirellula lacrimiformis]|uniref:Serine/threonine-protein phosphatase 1 n=1 Tax=Rubripirellula lacrimiformis TaxID=1930273 RepID=A0A517NF65_9BACT|nr:metallophosphoesterase family protein [Rubripirellula lacrimiformis]QDT05774.1 Serine/threonine-protein phosphatase 1 [Rubripirellula lacrimiformis]
MRRFAIGDVHGCSKALRTLIETIAPTPEDELVFLGDYVDRGPDSRDVVDQVIALQNRCRVVTLRGNHEIMLQGVARGGLSDTVWLANGGQATVSSYGGSLDKLPANHHEFFMDLLPYYETAKHIFVHAGYLPNLSMPAQEEMTLYWNHLPTPVPPPHQSGKRVIVGHTPQPDNRILDAGHLVCIDTYCFGGGCLTAMDVETGDMIQTNRHGHVQRPPILSAALTAKKIGKSITKFCRQRFGNKTQDLSAREDRHHLFADRFPSS